MPNSSKPFLLINIILFKIKELYLSMKFSRWAKLQNASMGSDFLLTGLVSKKNPASQKHTTGYNF